MDRSEVVGEKLSLKKRDREDEAAPNEDCANEDEKNWKKSKNVVSSSENDGSLQDLTKVNYAAGKWDEEKKLVYVVRFKGKYLGRMGFLLENKHWLYPEESTFLISNGELRLASESDPTELMEPHIAFLTCYRGLDYHGMTLTDYYICNKLLKLRFIVVRHDSWRDGQWVLDGSKTESQSGNLQKQNPKQESNHIQGEGACVSIRYYVYKPKKSFKKSEPGTPDFCVAVSSPVDKVPPLTELQSLTTNYSKLGIPVKVAIFEGQNVSFLSIEPFQMHSAGLLNQHPNEGV